VITIKILPSINVRAGFDNITSIKVKVVSERYDCFAIRTFI